MDDVFSAHRRNEDAVLDPAKTAVIVVDMINEFCKPGGRMVLPGYEALMPAQKALVAAARSNGVPVIWVDARAEGARGRGAVQWGARHLGGRFPPQEHAPRSRMGETHAALCRKHMGDAGDR
ncbi:isochorismatase family protein [Sinorhizobium medicae]